MKNEDTASQMTLWKLCLGLAGSLWVLLLANPVINTNYGALNLVFAVLVFAILVTMSLRKRPHFEPWLWPLIGAMAWALWRFAEWFTSDRQILFIANAITNAFWASGNLDGPGLVTGIVTASLLAGCIWGAFHIWHHFDKQWLSKSKGIAGLFFALTIITSLYVSFGNIQSNCFGIYLISPGLHCAVRGQLGFAGTVFVNLVIMILPLAVALNRIEKNADEALILVSISEPFWIQVILNPTQILGAHYFELTRISTVADWALIPLQIAARVIEALPVMGFLFIVPVGLMLIRSLRLQLRWAQASSLMIFALMASLFIWALASHRAATIYSLVDYVAFLLFFFQFLLPVFIVSSAAQKMGQGNNHQLEE